MPPAGWRGFSASELPTDPAEYLAASIIVLENAAAVDLSETQQQRLRQYVRDIGGAALILGGDRAFAAGGYEGSILNSLCPLASDPPGPTAHWILLADSSGSMSASEGGSTRFAQACAAIGQVLPHLPPHDLVSIGGFSEGLSWWTRGKPVEQSQSQPLPPPGAFPHGPTNLRQALDAIASSTDGHLPEQLLVLSDFDAQLGDTRELRSLLHAKHIRLHLLAIGEGSALAVMRQLAASTAGVSITQLDPKQWAQSARELMQAASQDRIERDPVTVTFRDEAATVPAKTTSLWNRVWVKSGAIELAETSMRSETIPMAARWHDGEGQTAALAFDADAAQVEALRKLIERPPHDPRFHVSFETGERLQITVDAVDSDSVLNDEPVSVDLTDLSDVHSPGASQPVPQTAPGRYELSVPAPRSAALATVRDRGRPIAQSAIAGRYPAEFEALGNDHAAMSQLANQTGGQIILPDQASAIQFHWPRKPVPLTSLLAIAGAAMIAIGLAWWKLR
jgi:hypothetical protein